MSSSLKFLILTVFLTQVLVGQSFNFPGLLTANQYNPQLKRQQGSTYLLNFISTDRHGWRPVISKYDNIGTQEALDTIYMRNWNQAQFGFQPAINRSSMVCFDDTSIYVYGSFAGCDAVRHKGYFLQQYDLDLNVIRSNYFIDSVLGITRPYHLPNGDFVLSNSGSAHILNPDLTIKHYFRDASLGGMRGDLVLSDGKIIRNRLQRQSGADTTYILDPVTGSKSGMEAISGTLIQISDSLIAQVSAAGKIYLISLPGLQALDSLNLTASLGFQHSFIHHSEGHIIFSDTSHLAILSLESLEVIHQGSMRFEHEDHAIWYSDSVIALASTHGRSIVGLESYPVSDSPAPLFDSLAIKLKQHSLNLVSLDTVAPGVRSVRAEVDWEITIFNMSQDTLSQAAFSYSYYSSFNCGGDNELLLVDSLNVYPGDSTTIMLSKLVHLQTSRIPTFYYYLHMRPVMANRNLLRSKWYKQNRSLENISVEHSTINSRQISVYPNPFESKLSVKHQENRSANIIITTLTGKEVYSKYVESSRDDQIRLSLPELPAGLYVINLQGKESSFSTIIEKN